MKRKQYPLRTPQSLVGTRWFHKYKDTEHVIISADYAKNSDHLYTDDRRNQPDIRVALYNERTGRTHSCGYENLLRRYTDAGELFDDELRAVVYEN